MRDSISPNACVITDQKPEFLTVTDILKFNTDNTLDLLKKELEIELDELQEQWHFSSLERIFIEQRIYHDIEEEETWEGVLAAIDKGLKPHIAHLIREVTEEDITRLTEIKIKRISKFDLDKAQQFIESLEDKIANVKHHLAHLVDFAVEYFKNLKAKYGKDKERRTEIRTFDTIDASKVAVANTRFYVDRVEGFIGTSLKKDEFLFECSDIDDIIVFRQDGTMIVTKVDAKTFVGKGIIHVGVWRKNDKRTIYNLIYRDAKNGPAYQKRFAVTGITRDKEYDLTAGNKGSEVLYFSANPNGEAEVISIILKTHQRIKKLKFDLDFADLAVKGRSSKGNLVTKYPIKKIELKEEGVSTLAPRQIWYDPTVRRLNADERGDLLGSFKGDDKILTINSTGEAKLVTFDLGNRFDDEMIIIEKWKPNKPITCVYYDGTKDKVFVKRFVLDDTLSTQVFFVNEDEKSEIKFISTDYYPMIELNFSKIKGIEREPEVINLEEFIAVKGIKAQGNQLTSYKLRQIVTLESLLYEEPEEIIEEDEVQPTLFDSVEGEEDNNID